MKIIDRHVFSSFISIFFFCAVFLCILYVVGDIFGFLDEILREGITPLSLGMFYLYMMPFVIIQIAPVSCLLSSVFLLGNLNRHNEITALKASGVSLLSIIRPMLVSAIVVGLLIFILNDKVVPYTMRMANKIRYEKLEVGKRDKSGPVLMRNIALYGKGNRIIFAKEFDIKKSEMRDVIIHTQDETQNIVSKISAKTVSYRNGSWAGEEAIIYNIDRNGRFIGTPEVYAEYAVPIIETPLDFINNQWQPEYMGYMQLKNYLNIFLMGSKSAYRRFSVDLQYKLAFPLSCAVMILVAAPFTLVTQRGKALLGMARGILIALTYIPIIAIGLALGKGGTLPPFIAAWSANIILGGTGLYFSLKH